MAHRHKIILFAASSAVIAALAALGWLTASLLHDPTPPIVVEPLQPFRMPGKAGPAIVEAAAEEPDTSGDPLIRKLVGELSNHPKVTAWLLTDDLIHRFVVAVDAVAGGYSPRQELDFMKPAQPFVVEEQEGRLVVTRGCYHRYDLAAEVFASIDTAGAVALLDRLAPVLEQAHQEVAWPHAGFTDRLVQAMDHLLEVEVPEDGIELEQRVLTYAFADDSLESLTDAQRHLIRLGPRNARLVQGKLRELRRALAPETEPGAESASLIAEARPQDGIGTATDDFPTAAMDAFWQAPAWSSTMGDAHLAAQ